MFSLKTILPLAAAAAIVCIGTLSARNGRLADRVADLERAEAAMASELTASREALAAREIESRRLADETRALKQKLQEVYAHDSESQVWADADCPGGVLECLRR